MSTTKKPSKKTPNQLERLLTFTVPSTGSRPITFSIYRCNACGKVFVGRHRRLCGNKSCGCLLRKHGLSTHPLHRVWVGMWQRCTNKKSLSYSYYGGRGIKVTKAWRKFQKFYDWAVKAGWKAGLQLDRINNDSGYGPFNCRFTTRNIQQQNRRDNRITKEEADYIRKRVVDGASQNSMAKIFGLRSSTVCEIIKGKIWK